MKTNLSKEILLGVVCLLPIVYLVFIWNQLPESIPTHWNIKGEIDDYSSKSSTFFMVGLPIAIAALMKFLPLIDPRKENYEAFASSYFKLRFLLVLFMALTAILILYVSVNPTFAAFPKVLSVMICLLFAGIGNYMTTVKPNFFVGIRTPWTLASEEVWRKTHLLGGKLWFWTGLALIIPVFFLSSEAFFPIMLIGIILMSFVPIMYAYFIFQKEKR